MNLRLGTAAVTAVLLSGCGSSPKPPTVAAIATRLGSDPGAKVNALTPVQLSCVAGVLRTYIKPSDLTAYVAGTRAFADLQGSNAAAAQAAVVACVRPNP